MIDVRSGKQRTAELGGEVARYTFSADGTTAAIAVRGAGIQRWDLATLQPVDDVPVPVEPVEPGGSEAWVSDDALTRVATRVVGGTQVVAFEGGVRVGEDLPTANWTGPQAALGPGGRRLVVAEPGTGRIAVWDVDEARQVMTFLHDSTPQAVTFSADDLDAGTPVGPLLDLPSAPVDLFADGGTITDLAMSADGSHLQLVTTAGHVVVWDVTDKAVTRPATTS